MNKLRGGKADGVPRSAFNPKDLAEGMREEAEHTDDPQERKEIAADHLVQDKRYYKKLKQVEKAKAFDPEEPIKRAPDPGMKELHRRGEKVPEAERGLRRMSLAVHTQKPKPLPPPPKARKSEESQMDLVKSIIDGSISTSEALTGLKVDEQVDLLRELRKARGGQIGLFGESAEMRGVRGPKAQQTEMFGGGGGGGEGKKEGEGSRGGKVIGHTKSGKAIYDQPHHPQHAGFNPGEQKEAEEHNQKIGWERIPESKEGGWRKKGEKIGDGPKGPVHEYDHSYPGGKPKQPSLFDKGGPVAGDDPDPLRKKARKSLQAVQRGEMSLRKALEPLGALEQVDFLRELRKAKALPGQTSLFGGTGAVAATPKAEAPKSPAQGRTGEGSRGGHVIGHTTSGKPIYESANHPEHAGFTAGDHHEAAKLHHEQVRALYGEGEKQAWETPDAKRRGQIDHSDIVEAMGPEKHKQAEQHKLEAWAHESEENKADTAAALKPLSAKEKKEDARASRAEVTSSKQAGSGSGAFQQMHRDRHGDLAETHRHIAKVIGEGHPLHPRHMDAAAAHDKAEDSQALGDSVTAQRKTALLLGEHSAGPHKHADAERWIRSARGEKPPEETPEAKKARLEKEDLESMHKVFGKPKPSGAEVRHQGVKDTERVRGRHAVVRKQSEHIGSYRHHIDTKFEAATAAHNAVRDAADPHEAAQRAKQAEHHAEATYHYGHKEWHRDQAEKAPTPEEHAAHTAAANAHHKAESDWHGKDRDQAISSADAAWNASAATRGDFTEARAKHHLEHAKNHQVLMSDNNASAAEHRAKAAQQTDPEDRKFFNDAAAHQDRQADQHRRLAMENLDAHDALRAGHPGAKEKSDRIAAVNARLFGTPALHKRREEGFDKSMQPQGTKPKDPLMKDKKEKPKSSVSDKRSPEERKQGAGRGPEPMEEEQPQPGTPDYHAQRALAHLAAAQAHANAHQSAKKLQETGDHDNIVQQAEQATQKVITKGMLSVDMGTDDEVVKYLEGAEVGTVPSGIREDGRSRLAGLRGERFEKSGGDGEMDPAQASGGTVYQGEWDGPRGGDLREAVARAKVAMETVEDDPAGNHGQGGLAEWFKDSYGGQTEVNAPVGKAKIIRKSDESITVIDDDDPYTRASRQMDPRDGGAGMRMVYQGGGRENNR